MKKNTKETDPIDYMLACRRPKTKRSKKKRLQQKFLTWRPYLLKAGVSVACMMMAVGGSVLTYTLSFQKGRNMPKQSSEQPSGLSQREINELTHSVDSELLILIDGYQKFNRLSPRLAVDTALYDMWERFDTAYKNNPTEENNLLLGHISKRGKQANRMLLSNTIGDNNPFLEMLYNDVHEKVLSSENRLQPSVHSR